MSFARNVERFTVLPSIDISGGRCIRMLHGRFGSETVYSDDPVEVAVGFCAAGARWLHVVDLDGARSGSAANREVVLEVARRVPRPVQIDGGIGTRDEVEELLAARATRVALSPAALENPDEVAGICSRYGDRICVALDVRGDNGEWSVGSGTPVGDVVAAFEAAGASRLIYSDRSREGTMQGPDLLGLQRIIGCTRLPVIAAGGVASLDDLRQVARMRWRGVVGAIVGRALYEHKFHLGEAINAADQITSEAMDLPDADP